MRREKASSFSPRSGSEKIKKDFESGALNLSQSSMIASSVRQKEKEIREKNLKEKGSTSSGINPNVNAQLTVDQKKELVDLVKNKNLQESQVLIAKTLDLKIKKSDKKSLQQDESVRIETTLSKDQMAMVTRVKELISHINPDPSMAEIIEFLAKDYIKRKDPLAKKPIAKVTAESEVTCKREGVTTEKEKREGLSKNKSENDGAPSNVTADSAVKNIKPIQAKIARFIFQRDQVCQWKTNGENLNNGDDSTLKTQICGSKFQLQIDHKKPRWQGGENASENLQILCRVHNVLKYKRESAHGDG